MVHTRIPWMTQINLSTTAPPNPSDSHPHPHPTPHDLINHSAPVLPIPSLGTHYPEQFSVPPALTSTRLITGPIGIPREPFQDSVQPELRLRAIA